METYWIGMGFLVLVFAAVPAYRRMLHARSLKGLNVPGAQLRPRFWGLSGLDYPGKGWTAELRFEPPPIGSDGRRGHLRFAARFATPAPPLRLPEGLKDGEAVVEGDADYARRLLTPEFREQLKRLQALGGRAESLGGAAVEISGPLPDDARALADFVGLCGAIADRTAAEGHV